MAFRVVAQDKKRFFFFLFLFSVGGGEGRGSARIPLWFRLTLASQKTSAIRSRDSLRSGSEEQTVPCRFEASGPRLDIGSEILFNFSVCW